MEQLFNTLNNKIATQQEEEGCKELLKHSYLTNQKSDILMKAFGLNPRNANVLIQLGLQFIHSKNKMQEYTGYTLLEKAFDYEFTKTNIPIHSYQGKWLAIMIGRYNHLRHRYKTSRKFFRLAQTSTFLVDDSQAVQSATCITGYPEIDENVIQRYNDEMDQLLSKENIDIKFLQPTYNFLMLSPFNLEIYYEADFRDCMQKYYQLTTRIFPELKYTSTKISKEISSSKPYQLGIISAYFTKNNSVIADFKGVLDRLPRDIFDITFIFLIENQGDNEFVYKNEKHIVVHTYADPNWLSNTREKIENLDLDILYYLDSTMSSVIQRTLMSKLARIQAVSHGHPVTTGVPSDIMNYYVSWGAAELEYEQAKQHYTEKLLLLPKEHMHQYYEPRVDENGISKISGESYFNYTRDDFYEYVPSDGNWYTCMQKPFKRHPDFDPMLGNILEKDPNARILLHKENNEENNEIFMNRYKRLKMDVSRIHFIPALPHHKLMALYKMSHVVLDSYYAGGCTTTREALEIGALVVTLPAKYLGSRWSLAYYNRIGVLDLVAENKKDYVDIAVDIATNEKRRKEIRKRVLDNMHKLFYQESAIDSWTNIFQQMINNY